MAGYDQDVPSSGAAHLSAYRSSRRLLGERVQQARREARWTQQQLATEVGIHPCKLSRYERGSDSIPAWLLLKMVERLPMSSGQRMH
jgi:DNA-binding XRE family transcriptional regulator